MTTKTAASAALAPESALTHLEQGAHRQRRNLLRMMVAASASLVGLPNAIASATPAEAPDAPSIGPNDVVLDRLALAILQDSRASSQWSANQFIRKYLRGSRQSLLPSFSSLVSGTYVDLIPAGRELNAIWRQFMLGQSEFHRGRALRDLFPVLQAYGDTVRNAQRHLLPLDGRGIISYDYIDELLYNDPGLVLQQPSVAAKRFASMSQQGDGALVVLNLPVSRVTPALRASPVLYSLPAPSPDVAERLVSGAGQMLQFLEVELVKHRLCDTQKVAVPGVSHPLFATGKRFLICSRAGMIAYEMELPEAMEFKRKQRC